MSRKLHFLYRSRMKMKTNYSSRQAFSSLRKQRLSRKEHPLATLFPFLTHFFTKRGWRWRPTTWTGSLGTAWARSVKGERSRSSSDWLWAYWQAQSSCTLRSSSVIAFSSGSFREHANAVIKQDRIKQDRTKKKKKVKECAVHCLIDKPYLCGLKVLFVSWL